jgi:DEAD/DEAH box helicase domain-containing protein
VASGKFWIWSVTWDDVRSALNAEIDTSLADDLDAMCFNRKEELPPSLRAMLNGSLWSHHSIAVLIRWLATPTGDNADQAVIKTAQHAGATAFRMVPNPSIPALEEARNKLAQFWTTLANLPCERSAQGVGSGNVNDLCLTFRYWWAKELAIPASTVPVNPGFVIYDESQANDEPTRHLSWRRWLWLFNIFQTLPGVLLATQLGLQGNDYAGLTIITSVRPGSGAQAAAHGAAWEQVLEQTLSILVDGLSTVMAVGLPPPDEVGYELEQAGEVVAEAELAWIGRKLVLLMPVQANYQPFWEQNGWRPVIAEGQWQERIMQELSTHVVDNESQQEKK